jgi:hypothetical protein
MLRFLWTGHLELLTGNKSVYKNRSGINEIKEWDRVMKKKKDQ